MFCSLFYQKQCFCYSWCFPNTDQESELCTVQLQLWTSNLLVNNTIFIFWFSINRLEAMIWSRALNNYSESRIAKSQILLRSNSPTLLALWLSENQANTWDIKIHMRWSKRNIIIDMWKLRNYKTLFNYRLYANIYFMKQSDKLWSRFKK